MIHKYEKTSGKERHLVDNSLLNPCPTLIKKLTLVYILTLLRVSVVLTGIPSDYVLIYLIPFFISLTVLGYYCVF